MLLALITAATLNAQAGIPEVVVNQAIRQCTLDTMQPVLCECIMYSIADSYKKFGYSLDKPPTEVVARIMMQTANNECQGLAPIKQTEN